MRNPLLVVLFALSLFSKADDTLPKLKLKPVDLKFYFALTSKESSTLNIEFVNSFTQNQKYNDPAFYAGYSDTAKRRHNFNHHHRDKVYKNDYKDEVYVQFGSNVNFQFENSKKRILRRIKPNIGIFHSSRRVFAYNVRVVDHYPTDTLFYQDPKYAPIIYDTLVYRNIYYRYSSQQVYLEAGIQFNFYQSNRFVVYSALKYGFGYGYNNEFYVQKDQFLENILEPVSKTIERNKEPPSYSSRITVPFGIQTRFKRKRYKDRVWCYAEICPGYETYKIKNGRSLAHGICVFTWGLKFQLK